jgi:hypothetical protein
MANLLKSLKDSEEIRRMSPRMRLAELSSARQEGADWQMVYENIRGIVDPMDVMSDTQIFGAEIPWELWR